MVRINTYYDTEIKKEVFKISGDVGYTKSTDTVLTKISFDNSRVEYGIQTFSVNVLGDRGESKIIIFDNDEPIPITVNGEETDMIDWSRNISSPVEFSVKLNYDVEHNIQARYQHNDRCLGSKSMNIPIFENMPQKYSSTLSRYNDTNINYDNNVTFSLPIQFRSGQTLLNQETKTIDVIIDDDYENKESITITIPANQNTGNASLEVTGGLNAGVHTITLQFDGDEHHGATSHTFQISSGYNVEITEYDPISVNYTPVTLRTRVTNQFGQGISGISVEDALTHEETITDTEGYCTHTYSTETLQQYPTQIPVLEIVHSAEIDSNSHESNHVQVRRYFNVTFSITPDTTIVGTGRTSTLNLRTSGIDRSIPVTFAGGGLDGTYYTSDEGQLIKQYEGRSAGDVTITASTGTFSSQVKIEDVIQYWNANGNSLNKSYSRAYGNFQELSNGYKFFHGAVIAIDLSAIEDDWKLIFNIVNAYQRYQTSTGVNNNANTYATVNNDAMVFYLAKDTSMTNDSFGAALMKVNLSQGNTVEVNKNDFTMLNEGEYPLLLLKEQSTQSKATDSYITINNLKLKRV